MARDRYHPGRILLGVTVAFLVTLPGNVPGAVSVTSTPAPTPLPHAVAAGAAPVPAQAEPALDVVDVNGVRVHYLALGDGEPVVFVHGTLGDYSYWLPHLDSFDDRYRTVTYSRRHSYPNENGEPAADYSARVDALDLAALIEILELQPAHLVGLSYGALTALLLTAERPDLVQTLVLTEPPVDPRPLGLGGIPDLPTTEPPWLDGFARYAEMVRAGDVREAIAVFLEDVEGKPGFTDTLPQEVWTRLMRNATDFAAMTTSSEPLPPIHPADLREIRTPTLLLVGQHNVDGAFEHQNDRLLQLIPGAEAITIPDAGHLLWSQQPELTRQAVLGFLQRWDRPAE